MTVKARFGRAAKRARKAARLAAEQLRALRWRKGRTRALHAAYLENPDRSAKKTWARSAELVAKSRAEYRALQGKAAKARRDFLRWEKALAAWRRARRKPYPHLSGDLDSDARVLRKLENLAKAIGRNIYVTSGNRTDSEQLALYRNRHSNPYPVAYCCPCASNHCGGDAADCLVGGSAIQNVVPASTIRAYGLEPLAGDAVHLEG